LSSQWPTVKVSQQISILARAHVQPGPVERGAAGDRPCFQVRAFCIGIFVVPRTAQRDDSKRRSSQVTTCIGHIWGITSPAGRAKRSYFYTFSPASVSQKAKHPALPPISLSVIARLLSMAELERRSYGIAFGRSSSLRQRPRWWRRIGEIAIWLGAASKVDRASRLRTAVGAINSNLKFWIQISVTRGM
jgi:hypothetical protein